jgi:hypothetical protein
MMPPAVPAMPDSSRAAPADARPGYGTRFLVACYTGVGAAGCAFMFYISTLPVTIPDDWGAQVPSVFGAIATMAFMLAAWPWVFLPLPLLIAGLTYLRGSGWRWLATWAVAVAAGAALEAMVITRTGYHYPSPTYVGPGIVSWVSLTESLGFAALGAAMMAILAGAERSAAHPAAGRPPA